MINKSKTLVLGLAAMATLGLAGCGETSGAASSGPDIAPISQNDSSIPDVTANLQLVGDVKSDAEGTVVATWDPTTTNNPHFTKVSKMLYTLSNVTIYGNGDTDDSSQFKFTYDDKWSNDFGFDAVQFDAAVSADFKNAGGNIKCLVAGTYDFEYHPFFVAEEGVAAKMVIKAATLI
ncbi:MAG: hypothetical protein LKG11_03140 [Bacilli bacterium]|jgi:hypothetical protein|nr:hypothetical protein [Bacilli bacterium]